MSATLTSQVLKVTNGVCGVTHTATAGRTLCGRDTAGMLILSEMDTWERIGWDAASKGACMRCERAAAKTPAVAPIVVDSTPRGLFTAMMRANSTDAHGLVNVLAQALRRALAAEYGTVAGDHVYTSIMSACEYSDDVIAYGLSSAEFARTEDVEMRDLRIGDTVSTDVGPVLLVADSGTRGLLDVRHFTGRILSVPSVPDHCTWILRSNVGTGHSVDYWAVQGISTRAVRRYL